MFSSVILIYIYMNVFMRCRFPLRRLVRKQSDLKPPIDLCVIVLRVSPCSNMISICSQFKVLIHETFLYFHTLIFIIYQFIEIQVTIEHVSSFKREFFTECTSSDIV